MIVGLLPVLVSWLREDLDWQQYLSPRLFKKKKQKQKPKKLHTHKGLCLHDRRGKITFFFQKKVLNREFMIGFDFKVRAGKSAVPLREVA